MITNITIENRTVSNNILKSIQFPLQGKITMHGLVISVENRKGSKRSGVSPEGKKWSTTMKIPYGYILGVKGVDKDHLDCFVGDKRDSELVFVIKQLDEKGNFDEHKIMLGFDNSKEAKKMYLAHYDSDRFFGSMIPMLMDRFKKIIKHNNGVSKVKENSFDYVVMNKEDFIKEHKELIETLKSGSNKKRITEANKQNKELKEY